LAGLAREDREGVVVVAVGGGATIDLAKAIAAMATNMPADICSHPDLESLLDTLVVDHLEGVGRGLTIRHWPLPVVAVPTTAGTGAEATRNAVISCPRRRFKKSMRSPMMVPRVAVVDPDLTASCDPATIAASGLDCITQLIESFVCRFAKPLPRSLVLESLPRALHALPRLLEHAAPDADPQREATSRAADRAAVSHAALLSGIALTNSGLGLAHGVAAALGIACSTPHGVACAVMLPAAMRINRSASEADFATLERAVAPDASRNDAAAADSFVDRIERLCRIAGVPRRLSEVGVAADQLDWLAENSGGTSMRGNPVQLSPAELRSLLTAML
jgi:alcohol dehydrogenase class IV